MSGSILQICQNTNETRSGQLEKVSKILRMTYPEMTSVQMDEDVILKIKDALGTFEDVALKQEDSLLVNGFLWSCLSLIASSSSSMIDIDE